MAFTGDSELLTLEAAARQMRVSVKTVRRYIASGHLQGLRLGPTLIRVDAADVAKLLRPMPAAPSTSPAPSALPTSQPRPARRLEAMPIDTMLNDDEGGPLPTNLLLAYKGPLRLLTAEHISPVVQSHTVCPGADRAAVASVTTEVEPS